MQFYTVIVVLAVAGLAAANPMPTADDVAYRNELVDKLYKDVTMDAASTRNVLVQLRKIGFTDVEDRRLYGLLLDIGAIDVKRCEDKIFAGLGALISWFKSAGNSPALANYIIDTNEKLRAVCMEEKSFTPVRDLPLRAAYYLFGEVNQL